MSRISSAILAFAIVFASAAVLHAQPAPLKQTEVTVRVDSGAVTNLGNQREAVYSTVVSVPDHPWIRLRFDDATLGQQPPAGQVTVLRITSLTDGAVQTLTAEQLRQWRYTSAYFNGDTVQVEIISDPGAAASSLIIGSAWVGEEGRSANSICGGIDDRELSSDQRSARVVPIGCSVWMIDDANHCFLTAGHCTGSGFDIVEFNVPLSNSNGTINHPPPEDQYAIDRGSVQSNGGQGVGNDYAYFGTFVNAITMLTPFEAQGDFYVLVDAPQASGQSIRITGYGTTSFPVPNEWNQVQKTHVGPYVGLNGTAVRYTTDTTGGNSGSPVILEDTGETIGIHTHGGCEGDGYNNGTASQNSGLQGVLANPMGVCTPALPLAFVYPNGLPEYLDPAGDSIRVEVVGQNEGQPQPGTGRFFYDTAGGFVEGVMDEIADNVYDAVFPAIDCGLYVSFYFSAETVTQETVTDPSNAPDDSYTTASAVDIVVVLDDDFETDTGWTTIDAATSGEWERGVPVVCGRGDPPTDADGSGQCYLTENDPVECNSDVDTGTVTLVSPILDATGETSVSYYRWYDNTFGDEPMADIFEVEVSDDGGTTWFELETVGPAGDEVSGGWFHKTFLLADVPGFERNNQFQIRFIASDLAGGSVVEAAVDGFKLFELECAVTDCFEDLDQSGSVDFGDILAILTAWGNAGGPEDLDGSGTVDFGDIVRVLSAWGPCE